MPESLAEVVGRWDLAGERSTVGELFNLVHERITFLQRLHFDQYIPTLGSDQVTDFESRLLSWLDRLPDEGDRRLLLELVPNLIFLGRDEFSKLYQAAFRGPILRWVIESASLDFLATDFDARLDEEVHDHTWFCALSDSMQISDFCHANHLAGAEYRPDFRTLEKFGDLTKITTYMRTRRRRSNGPIVPLKRIVVLEDFIGSGVQFEEAHTLVGQLLTQGVPVLLVPLVLCPDGATSIQSAFGGNSSFRCEPVLRLADGLFINSRSTLPNGSFGQRIRGLATSCYSLVVGDNAAHPRPYSAFGFHDTGALVVMYSNTPANTISMVQHSSNSWNPLFPRSARVK